VSMDTACSSALVATHTAAAYVRSSSVHSGHSALAGGVSLMLSESTTAAAQAAGMLNMEGRCKTLDAAADGYVRYVANLNNAETHLNHVLTFSNCLHLVQSGGLHCVSAHDKRHS
jgi:hypothetical protein